MTAKRFTINNDMNLEDKVETYELSCVVDNENKTFYFIVDSIANVESFVERLNELHEENQTLKDSVMSWSKSYNRVYEENIRLKTTCKALAEAVTKLQKENQQFRVENGEMEDYLARLEEENQEYEQTIKQILWKTEYTQSYLTPICEISVQVTPKMYNTLTELLKGRLNE